MVGRDDDEGVAKVDRSDGGCDRLIQLLGVVKRTQRIAIVVGVIDASRLHHQEISIVPVPTAPPLTTLQKVNGFEGHIREAGLPTRIGGTVPLPFHVAALEEAEHRQALASQTVELHSVVGVGVSRTLIFGSQVAAIRPAAPGGLLVQERVRHEMPSSAAKDHVDPVAERRVVRRVRWQRLQRDGVLVVAVVDVGVSGGRGGVGDARRADDTDFHVVALGLFEKRTKARPVAVAVEVGVSVVSSNPSTPAFVFFPVIIAVIVGALSGVIESDE